MKNILIAAFAVSTFIFSCTKTSEAGEQPVTASEESGFTKVQLTQLLTAHQWMYQEYYSHYVDEQNKGQRFYDRDSTNNPDEYLGDVVYTFYKNHKFTRWVAPYLYRGFWQFSDNKPTYLTLKFSFETEKDSIALFTTDRLNYFRVSDYHHFYTSLVPKQ